jgi:hypothetical protein
LFFLLSWFAQNKLPHCKTVPSNFAARKGRLFLIGTLLGSVAGSREKVAEWSHLFFGKQAFPELQPPKLLR